MVAGVLTGLRRGGRVAEGGGLLNRYREIIPIVGSNPIPSAIICSFGKVVFPPCEGTIACGRLPRSDANESLGRAVS